MCKISVVRKRIVPDEEVLLLNDEFLPIKSGNSDLFMSKWLPLKPRKDIGWGLSLYDISKNYKISAIYDCYGNFSYWYCDIISSTFFPKENKYIIKDLLLDVKWDNINAPTLLDEDELEEMFSKKAVSEEEYVIAKLTGNRLINMMESGNFPPDAFKEIPDVPPEGFVRAVF